MEGSALGTYIHTGVATVGGRSSIQSVGLKFCSVAAVDIPPRIGRTNESARGLVAMLEYLFFTGLTLRIVRRCPYTYLLVPETHSCTELYAPIHSIPIYYCFESQLRSAKRPERSPSCGLNERHTACGRDRPSFLFVASIG